MTVVANVGICEVMHSTQTASVDPKLRQGSGNFKLSPLPCRNIYDDSSFSQWRIVTGMIKYDRSVALDKRRVCQIVDLPALILTLGHMMCH